MKIGIDIRTLMDKEYSGVSEYTLSLLREILAQDKVNQYKLFYNSYKDVSAQIPDFKSDNVEIVYTRYPNKLFNNVMQRILRWPKIDRLLDVDLFFMPNIGFIALSLRCKKVITVHDLSFLRSSEFFSPKRQAWHHLMNIKKMFNRFDKIIAVSQNTKRDIVELCKIDQRKIEVIYSGVDSVYKKIEKTEQAGKFKEIKEKYNLPEKFIFFLGTIEPRKNIDGLIRAYNKVRADKPELDSVKLVLAGGKGWKNDQVFQAHADSPYQEDIKFLGYIDRADKVYLYNLAELFVFPSFYEGFGFPPLEAMSCGAPVVGSNSSSLGEIVGRAGILVNPNNISEIAMAISELLLNQDLRQQLIKYSQSNVRRFNWSQTAQNYLREFKL